jgi:hypothetical protein
MPSKVTRICEKFPEITTQLPQMHLPSARLQIRVRITQIPEAPEYY